MAYITQAVSLTAVAALNGGDCGKGCAPGTRATFAAVSTAVSGGAPYLYVNAHDGAHDQWEALALTGWTHNPTDVFGFQDFIMVVNGEETLPLARSVDGGKSVTYLAGNTDMATHLPLAGAMITPDKLVLVGTDGYIYLSTDYGDSWLTVDAGVASGGTLTQVRICRQNPAVLYASGADGAIAASYNGGYAWVPLTSPSGDDITALEVLHENEIMVGTNALELWFSIDGGESWIKQADLPSLPTAGSIVALFCCACGAVEKHGVCYAVAADSSVAAAHRIYRNAGWGSGQWEIETGCASLVWAKPADLAAAHNNLALVVGGNGTNTGYVGLLS